MCDQEQGAGQDRREQGRALPDDTPQQKRAYRDDDGRLGRGRAHIDEPHFLYLPGLRPEERYTHRPRQQVDEHDRRVARDTQHQDYDDAHRATVFAGKRGEYRLESDVPVS